MSQLSQLTVSPDGSHLAYYLVRNKGIAEGKQLVLVSLGAGFENNKSRLQDPSQALSSSCGTILLFLAKTAPAATGREVPRFDGRAEDLISRKLLEYPATELFQCSSDRKVVAGWSVSRFESRPDTATLGGRLTISVDDKEQLQLLDVESWFSG